MRVRTIKPYWDGRNLHPVGKELEVPDDTNGQWYTVVEEPAEAKPAKPAKFPFPKKEGAE